MEASHRRIAICSILSKFNSREEELVNLQLKCRNDQGLIGTVIRYQDSLQFDMMDLASYYLKKPQLFEQSLRYFNDPSIRVVAPFQPKFFLPTAIRKEGCIVGFAGEQLPVLIWESGYYECHPSIGETLHDVVPVVRTWLTALLCPLRFHPTVCALMPPGECICDQISEVIAFLS